MARAFKTARCLQVQPEFSRLDKARRFFLVSLTLFIILLMGASIFYISTHIKAVGIGYKINKELSKKQDLIEANKKLRLEIARLKSLTRIETEAKEKLGLDYPQQGQILYLSKLEEADFIEKAPAEQRPRLDKQTKVSRVALAPTSTKTIQKKEKAPKTSTDDSGKSSFEKKKSRLIVAKIIRGTSRDKISKNNHSPKIQKVAKAKDKVPAVMLDPMP